MTREPALGAHLETSRVGYDHHGVYVGNGKVVHYAGFCGRWRTGPVEEVTLFGFSLGHTIRVVEHRNRIYSPQEIVGRARSRLGERNYRPLTNNCEHFCNWCIRGLSRSAQAERPLGLAIRLLAAVAARFVADLHPVLTGRDRGGRTATVDKMCLGVRRGTRANRQTPAASSDWRTRSVRGGIP